MFIKPYFRFKTFKTTYNDELNELKAPLSTLKLTLESIKFTEPIIPPTIKRG